MPCAAPRYVLIGIRKLRIRAHSNRLATAVGRSFFARGDQRTDETWSGTHPPFHGTHQGEINIRGAGAQQAGSVEK